MPLPPILYCRKCVLCVTTTLLCCSIRCAGAEASPMDGWYALNGDVQLKGL